MKSIYPHIIHVLLSGLVLCIGLLVVLAIIGGAGAAIVVGLVLATLAVPITILAVIHYDQRELRRKIRNT